MLADLNSCSVEKIQEIIDRMSKEEAERIKILTYKGRGNKNIEDNQEKPMEIGKEIMIMKATDSVPSIRYTKDIETKIKDMLLRGCCMEDILAACDLPINGTGGKQKVWKCRRELIEEGKMTKNDKLTKPKTESSSSSTVINYEAYKTSSNEVKKKVAEARANSVDVGEIRIVDKAPITSPKRDIIDNEEDIKALGVSIQVYLQHSEEIYEKFKELSETVDKAMTEMANLKKQLEDNNKTIVRLRQMRSQLQTGGVV